MGFAEPPTRNDLSAAMLEKYPGNGPGEQMETDDE